MSHSPATPRFVRFALGATAAGLLAAFAWLQTPASDAMPDAHAGRLGRASVDGPAVVSGPAERLAGHPDGHQPLGWLQAPPGSRFRYRVTDRGDYAIKNPEAGTQPAGQMHAECFVETTVLARRSGEVLIRQQITALQFLGTDGRVMPADAIQVSLQAAMVEPVLCRLDDHGKVLGYGFADGLDGDQRNFLRGTLAVITFQAPPEQGTAWTSVEADTMGDYEARYEVLPAAAVDTVTVRRTRLCYTAVAGQQELPKHELRGAGEATFSSRLGWLSASRLDEGATFALPLLEIETLVQRRAEAELVAADHFDVAIEASDWNRADDPVTGRSEQTGQYAAAGERHRWQQRLQGVTLAQMLQELAGLLAEVPADAHAINEAFQMLQWLVKLDDRAAAAIGEQLATRELRGDLAGVALSSLGAAATAAAQSVLAAVRADRNLDANLREHATIATLQLAQPTAELIEGLARDAAADFDGRANAMLVLGALAPRAGRLADGRTPAEALLAMEHEAVAGGLVSTWLLAVGNAAPPETMAIVLRHLDDREPAVRSAALVALRRVLTTEAVAVLVERGLGDAAASVRREALLELGRRSDAVAWSAIERVRQGDADEELRHKAGEMLRARA